MKYLELSFNSAKLWVNNPMSKELIVDHLKYLGIGRSQQERKTKNRFNEPITKFQVANVLRTLMGERPLPTNRKTNIPETPEFLEMAEKSYIKYSTPKQRNGKLIQDTCTLNKAPFNSFNNNPVYTWEIIRKYLREREYFEKVVLFMENIFGENVIREIPFALLDKEKIKNHTEYQEFKKFLISIHRNGLIDFFEKGKATSITGWSIGGFSTLTFNSAPAKANVLSGTLLVPIEEKYIERIRNSKGISTILDSGVVLIEGIREDVYLDELNEFFLVNEILI